MNIRNEILEPDCFYHIYNRGVNNCTIFNEDKNYLFFLKKFLEYSKSVLEVYAYCLMPNHFHFVIKIKSKIELEEFLTTQLNRPTDENGLHTNDMVVSKQIGKFISSYSQAYNKTIARHGPLLESPFKRKKICDEQYLKNVIIYTHLNPVTLNENFEGYGYSSYRSILSNKLTNLKREDVLNLFGGKENFIYSHKYPPKCDFDFF
jgi:putative transposase